MRKRHLLSVVAVAAGILTPPSAGETFHLMQIEQVIGGVNGDTSAQAIQLRMRSTFQQFVAGARLRAWDAQGLNPVLLTDFDTNVVNNGCDVRVLIASANFANFTNPALSADFTLTNLIPPSYLAAGSITFENDLQTAVWWRLSWGGASYTGPTTGVGGASGIANDADGEFGPPFRGPLPSQSLQALLFQGLCAAQSASNAADYALTNGAAVFTNNAGDAVTVAQPCPADLDDDGVVGFEDLTLLLTSWVAGTTLGDIGGPGGCGVPDGVTDFFDLSCLLAAWAAGECN